MSWTRRKFLKILGKAAIVAPFVPAALKNAEKIVEPIGFYDPKNRIVLYPRQHGKSTLSEIQMETRLKLAEWWQKEFDKAMLQHLCGYK